MIEDFHPEQIESLDQDQPVTMLNLMRFRADSLDGDGSGWDAYVRYGQGASQEIRKRGGSIIWAGEVRGVPLGPVAEGNWDYAALVNYPTPAAFADMMESDDYAEANVHRINGCEAHLIMATKTARSALRD